MIRRPFGQSTATAAPAAGRRWLVPFQSERPAEIQYPRHLVAGAGTIDSLGDRLTELGVPTGPVLVVSDGILVELGLACRATRPLAAARYEPVVFGDVAGEPDVALLERLEQSVRGRAYVAVVGIGGGSALDPAKLAAAFATNGGSVTEYLAGRSLDAPTLPLVLIPTTAGTGAEASRNAIVAHDGRKVIIGSRHLAPMLALLDPTLTVTSPPGVTAASGLDALCHAFEATLSTFASTFTTVNALAAARTIARSLREAYENGSNLEARRAMLDAAFLAGLAINAVTLIGHSMAYTIATRTHLPHGVTTAMSLPYCLAYTGPGAPDRVDMLADAVGAESAALAQWVNAFAGELGIPGSLAEVGIRKADLDEMADDCVERYPRPNSPVPLERGRVRKLYGYFCSGDVDGAVRAMSEV